MNISFIDGTPAEVPTEFDIYVHRLKRILESSHTVHHMMLRDMTISPCIGCFGCWVKTPGRCLSKDDTQHICALYMASDVVVFASPVLYGFTSALLKTAQDKLIPLIHPYFESVNGEVHHRRRYGQYPKLALLLDRWEDIDDEDVDIITRIYHRMALNLKSQLLFVGNTNQSPEEVAHGIAAH